MRILRRRLGLTQKELAYVIGYVSDSQISHIENGSRTPHLAEVLMIELVFGVPAVSIFPQVRSVIGPRIRRRLAHVLADCRLATSSHPKVSYKTAQLERVVASLRSPDRFRRGEFTL